MVEKSIILRDWEVRAVLERNKTQIRRVIKPQPKVVGRNIDGVLILSWEEKGILKACPDATVFLTKCPYQPGDRLWVKETWLPYDQDHIINGVMYAYKANTTPDGESIREEYGYKWHSPIRMPKEATRIWLEVERVWIEKVQDFFEWVLDVVVSEVHP